MLCRLSIIEETHMQMTALEMLDATTGGIARLRAERDQHGKNLARRQHEVGNRRTRQAGCPNREDQQKRGDGQSSRESDQLAY
jgi:hypothetical protein